MNKWITLALMVLLFSCQKMRKSPMPLFEKVPVSQSGITFENTLPESVENNALEYEYFYNGAGVAAADFDADGNTDLLFISNFGHHKLYKNLGGLKFEDKSKESGISDNTGWYTGVTLVDINQDGLMDVYLSRSGRGTPKERQNQLWVNKGGFVFVEKAAEYGLNHAGYGSQAVFFDFDQDEDLDVFILNHNIKKISVTKVDSVRRSMDPYVGDQLLENIAGKYVNITQTSGIYSNAMGFGLGVVVSDWNADGWPDLYVSNDYGEHDYYYINQKNGRFKECYKTAFGHGANFGMGVASEDLNNNGRPDIMVLDMVSKDNFGVKTSMSGMNPEQFAFNVKNGFHYQYMYNSVQLNQGENHFSDIAFMTNMEASDWSWCPVIKDFDLDGNKDVFITNGIKRDFRNNDYRKYKAKRVQQAYAQKENYNRLIQELVEKTPSRKAANVLYLNSDVLTFSADSLAALATPSLSNGAIAVDLDNDGDLELVVNNVDAPADLLKNNRVENKQVKNIILKLHGPDKNRNAIGTKTIVYGDFGIQYFENKVVSGYLSASYGTIPIGYSGTIDSIVIFWNYQKKQVLHDVPLHGLVQISYRAEHCKPITAQRSAKEDSNWKLPYQHFENNYNDFAQESLLPHQLSKLGPALSVGDLNQDGKEDIYVGGAKDQPGQIFLQTEKGFVKKDNKVFEIDKMYEDNDAEFVDIDGDLDLDLVVISGSYEQEDFPLYARDRVYENKGDGTFIRKQMLKGGHGAKVVVGDLNTDGWPEIMVFNRAIVGAYPKDAKVRVWENSKGHFSEQTHNYFSDETIGLMTDATLCDIDQDQDQDLLVVGEWMAPKLFLKENGAFVSTPINTNGMRMEGWYFSVMVADFDQNGTMDIALGNLGENYKYRANASNPFSIYFDDFDKNGTGDIVLGYREKGVEYPLRGRECTANQMPILKKKFPTYASFASASLNAVLGEQKENALQKHAFNFASGILFQNSKGSFQFKTFPKEAQVSSINAFYLNSSNKQVHLYAAGNLLHSEIETPRADASFGHKLIVHNQEITCESNQALSWYCKGEVRQMQKIKVKESDYLLSAINGDSVNIFKLN